MSSNLIGKTFVILCDFMSKVAKGIGISVVAVIIIIISLNMNSGSNTDDGIIQYTISEMPSYADHYMIKKSINEATVRWQEQNPERVIFEYEIISKSSLVNISQCK